ncbi:helix-turn-helix transcriptional regulator [Sphingomonas sp. SORGH_AS_0879]|uniref:helix-turn-helix domain-containing protein n=1 Tax=Sphingomonas sp. SORGH_AS_0879 TaxID=3041790 RepID=UPI002781962C|nr:helix-turn-helix transcriptional regulator [Sphingomonas sp. SORGH_AS_0879]MDQ1231501.1 DNA-binding XRE family transcriptional regulator [Sphingomonas sp. SORGH_AS_0879]
MAAVTGSLAPEALGELLRDARENAKLTQAAAAQALNVARTTLVAIEQGQRRARLEELQKLAALYRGLTQRAAAPEQCEG